MNKLSLKNKKNFKHFFKYQFLITFIATIVLNVDYGLAVGVVYYIIMHIIRSIEPYSTLLGNIPGTELYKDINIYQQVNNFYFL